MLFSGLRPVSLPSAFPTRGPYAHHVGPRPPQHLTRAMITFSLAVAVLCPAGSVTMLSLSRSQTVKHVFCSP